MVSIALHDIIERRFPVGESKSGENNDSINSINNMKKLTQDYTNLEQTLKIKSQRVI